MSANVLEKPETVVATDDGDHERQTHYYRKTDIERAYLEGAEITALCGKKDRPVRDFTKFPICKTCEEVLSGIPE